MGVNVCVDQLWMLDGMDGIDYVWMLDGMTATVGWR